VTSHAYDWGKHIWPRIHQGTNMGVCFIYSNSLFFKINLEKCYDRMEWIFILVMVKALYFHRTFIINEEILLFIKNKSEDIGFF